ncbi:sodium/hydrogen exchanger NHE2, partial [Cardiosporidium cionae]
MQQTSDSFLKKMRRLPIPGVSPAENSSTSSDVAQPARTSFFAHPYRFLGCLLLCAFFCIATYMHLFTHTLSSNQKGEVRAVSVSTTASVANHKVSSHNLSGEVTNRMLQPMGSSPVPQPTNTPVEQALFFFLLLFLSAAIIEWLVSKIPRYAPPVSVVWFIYGMALYTLVLYLPRNGNIVQEGVIAMRQVDSSVVYFVILPILLYEATQNINWYKFKRFLWGGITLAILGVAFQVAALGILFYYTFMYQQTQSPWEASFLLASSLASTDAVAVLSVLNSVAAPEKLSVLFEGESLINDGSSVLLFQFFFFLISGQTSSPMEAFLMLIRLLLLGPLFGIFLGVVMYFWITVFRRHHLTQCLATISLCYFGYFVAEYFFQFSGPLTAVCYGLFVNSYGHIALDREAQEKHRHFVEGLALMGNSAIFILSGIIAFGMMSSMFHSSNWREWGYLFATYLYLNIARFVMIVAFSPILRKTGYGIKWKEIILLSWGGLRGGIVLALGLRVERDARIHDELTETVAFYISANVLLILLIHGTTFEPLYRFLNPYPPKPFRKVYLEKVMKMIDHQYAEEKNSLESHWLFQ